MRAVLQVRNGPSIRTQACVHMPDYLGRQAQLRDFVVGQLREQDTLNATSAQDTGKAEIDV